MSESHADARRLLSWSRDALRLEAIRAAEQRDADALWRIVQAHRASAASDERPSPHTERAYRRGLIELVTLWEGDLLKAAPDDLERYRARLLAGERPALSETPTTGRGRRPKRGPLAPATVALRLASAHALFAALRWAGAAVTPLGAAPRRGRAAPQQLERGYTERELIELLGHARDDDDTLIVLLGAHAALRVSEMLRLRWRHVDLDRHRLSLFDGTAGAADGECGLTRPLAAALRAARQRAALTGLGAGPDDPVIRLRSQFGIYRRVARLCMRAEVGFRGVAGLRRSAAERVYRDTGDLEQVRRQLRVGRRTSARLAVERLLAPPRR